MSKRTFLKLVTVASAISLAPGSLYGHSWYPRECCSDRDCRPANGMTLDDSGNRIVFIGQAKVWVSKYMRASPSRDGRVHICYRDVAGELDGTTYRVAICLFVPAES